jgi:serine phosphatase RsbU (regulator of sigma subunit)
MRVKRLTTPDAPARSCNANLAAALPAGAIIQKMAQATQAFSDYATYQDDFTLVAVRRV